MRATQFVLVSVCTTLAGCAGSHEESVRRDYAAAAEQRRAAIDDSPPDGTLRWYVARAMRTSPELEASFARWRAAVHDVSRERRLPEPVLSYAFYVRSVETRVGPQRHRLGLRQTFPWPARLTAGSEAAAQMARAESRRFDALSLAVRRRVAEAYWDLWRIRRTHQAQLEQDRVLDSIAESVQARVAVGAASLADLSQLQLRIERHHDHRDLHHEHAHRAAARLRAIVGLPFRAAVPTEAEPPEPARPVEDSVALHRALAEHPEVHVHDSLARASEESAARAEASRWPDLVLGVDWIETGDAAMPTAGNGKDPLIVSVAVQVPLWQGSYAEAGDAHRARAAAHEADREAALRQAEARLETTLSMLRDSERRIHLHERTLVPQAEAVYGSVLGAYHTGGAPIAQVLLAVQDMLELQVQLIFSRARHAAAWATLEHHVGRIVERQAAPAPDPESEAESEPPTDSVETSANGGAP